MTPVPQASVISPELALVCPELAARARAALPDRPWEAFVPRVPVSLPEEPPAPPPSSHSSVVRIVSLVPAALLLAFAALLVVGSLPSFGDRPSLAPPPGPDSVVVVSVPPHAAPDAGKASRQPAAARP